MPVSYTDPYNTDAQNAQNGPYDNPVARRLLATRAQIQDQGPQSLPEFQSARQRTSNQFDAQRQTTQNALERRFAAMGNLNSGEATKQIALASQANTEQGAQVQQDLDAQEHQALGQQRDAL